VKVEANRYLMLFVVIHWENFAQLDNKFDESTQNLKLSIYTELHSKE